jgi:hypothetical protein
MAAEDLANILSSMLESLPRVRIGRHMNKANFLVGDKVFAFVKDGGVAMKLPKETIAKLIGAADAVPLVMGKRVMKEWVVLQRKDPKAYKKDLALFKESAAFVAAQTSKKSR